jgi:hypothetical protein
MTVYVVGRVGGRKGGRKGWKQCVSG